MKKLKDYSFATKLNIAGKETTIHQTVTNIFQGETNQDKALQAANDALKPLLKPLDQAIKQN